MKLTVYTDGACSGNPGPGGYAAIILDEKGKEHTVSGHQKVTTNNQMEMRAVIASLQHIRKRYASNLQSLHIEYYVDSQYIIRGITEWMQNWKRKNWRSANGAVKNRELWELIDTLIEGLQIKWHWVKGHDGDEYNEKADQIAVAEIEKTR